jgi:protein SCO1
MQFMVGTMLWLVVVCWVAWIWIGREAPDTAPLAAESPTEQVGSDDADSAHPDTESPPASGNVVTPDQPSAKISFPARELPDFEFPECQGGVVSRDSLKGKPWVASFIFTRCITTCPRITLAMKELHDRIRDSNPDVRFVSFSVDSSHDTAKVLQQYSKVYSADPERWKFLTGDELKIHDLIRRGFTLYVKPSLGNERKPGFEVAHSNRVVLVNEDSIPVATFLATRDEDMIRLRRILDGKDEFPQPGPPAEDNGGDVARPGFELRESKDDPQDAVPESGQSEDPQAVIRLLDRSARYYRFVSRADSDSDSDSDIDGDIDGDGDGDETAVEAFPEDVNRQIDQRLPEWAANLPPVNAALNSLSAVLLLAGYSAIKKRNKSLHRNLMIAAFATSVCFLGCYLAYHGALGQYTDQHGRAFAGPQWGRVVYYSILWPHVILAALVPFLSVRVLWLAFTSQWKRHRRLARITFPIWMFVSVTGVVIYGMLYHWPSETPSVVL